MVVNFVELFLGIWWPVIKVVLLYVNFSWLFLLWILYDVFVGGYTGGRGFNVTPGSKSIELSRDNSHSNVL